MFFFLGITPEGTDPATVAPNHSPKFFADEGALVPGIKALGGVALDFLSGMGRVSSAPRVMDSRGSLGR